MNLRLVLVLVLANLRQLRSVLPGVLFVGIGLAQWIPIAVLSPSSLSGTRVGVLAPGLPEVAAALSRAGFAVVAIPDGETPEPRARDVDVSVSVTGPSSGEDLPRVARLSFAEGADKVVLDARLRTAVVRASEDYARRLSREAGLSPHAAHPIRMAQDTDGPLAKAFPAVATVIDSGRFVPPVLLAVCMSLAAFGILPVLLEAFHMPRGAGRLEALFPVRVRPREFVASLVLTQAVVCAAYAALVVGAVTAIARYVGLSVAPGFASAAAWSPIASACVVPFVATASTLFRAQTMALFAAAVAAACVSGISYVPTLATALGAPEASLSAWPFHGLLQEGMGTKAASVALTLCIGAVGFALACRRLDGRMLVRVDA